MTLPASIRITDVGPRDGLQNEPTTVSTASKVLLVDRLQQTGIAEVEVSGFVRPDRIPQLADAREVFEGIERVEGVLRSALVPNEHGWESALEAGVDKIAVFTSASESFSSKNINCTIAESLEWASGITTLDSGDIFSCGTNHRGLGPLQDGDVVEMEAAGLGRLRVDVKDALRREWPRLTRAQKEAAETKGPAG